MIATELEICAADLPSVYAARAGGATRVELCTALAMGGLTPPESMLRLSREVAGIKRHVLLRPRSGDFLYSPLEFRQLRADVECSEVAEADGIVIGFLTPDGEVDKARCRELIQALPGKSYTFHRAFDMTADPLRALDEIIDLGFHRILTSGCAPSALQGIEMLRRLNQHADNRIIIMAGCGVNASNARQIMEQTGVRSLHASASHTLPSRMRFRNGAAKMSAKSTDEFSCVTTSEDKVRALALAMNLR